METTKNATQEEEERRKRIAERQKNVYSLTFCKLQQVRHAYERLFSNHTLIHRDSSLK